MKSQFLLLSVSIFCTLSFSTASPSNDEYTPPNRLMGNKLSRKRMNNRRAVFADTSESNTNIFTTISGAAAPESFRQIEHPFKSPYANKSFDATIPTNSWISNLFYPSQENNAPTTSDPYILRVLDNYGGNPGLSVRQPSI
jgi:endoglucanase Acf2